MIASSPSLAVGLRQMLLVTLALGAETFPGCGGAPPRQEVATPAAVEVEVARLRAATATFRALDSAVAAGYARQVVRCLEQPPHGAMGFHHVNRTLLDDRVEVERPEILLYSRTAAGAYKLNGVEYVVPYSARPRDAEPPTVMGQKLKRSDPLALWYLHVWVWEENPSGLFADWNPVVTCPAS